MHRRTKVFDVTTSKLPSPRSRADAQEDLHDRSPNPQVAIVSIKLTPAAQPVLANEQTCFAAEIDIPTAGCFDLMPVSVVQAQLDASDARQAVSGQGAARQEIWVVARVVSGDWEWRSF